MWQIGWCIVMNNISFANPYLLLILIPIILIIVIPFIITFRKDNIGIRNVFSLVLHICITIVVCFVIAGMSLESVITETEVYVVADISYSSNKNLNTIDEYIDDLQDGLPKNSKVGVVCFAKGSPYVLAVPGQRITSVNTAVESVDQSGTDIAGALRYTATLFGSDVIKRMILITDGDETNDGSLVSIANELATQDVYIDAVYLDNNISENTIEAQIDYVELTPSTYKDKNEIALVTIQSNLNASTSNVTLYKDGVLVENQTRAPSLTRGLNVVSLGLDTSVAGTFTYRVDVAVNGDSSSLNNSYYFTQTVSENINVLFVSSNSLDEAKARTLYENDKTVLTFVNATTSAVPFTVEDLCKYDEYVLSNVDLRSVRNNSQFISNLNIMVSRYGKNLTTIGNTFIQTDPDNLELNTLSSMLPVRYGTSVGEGRVLGIVIDVSRSMEQSYHFQMAKEAACKLVDLAKEEDMIMVVGLSGETDFVSLPIAGTLGNKVLLKQKINNLEGKQGTLIGSSLYNAYQQMRNLPYAEKQLYLVSDGINYSSDPYAPADIAREMYTTSRIAVSAIGIGSQGGKLENVALNAGGKFYLAKGSDDLNDILINDLSQDIAETVVADGIERKVKINRYRDQVLTLDADNRITELPNIRGFYVSRAKNSATVVAETSYVTTTRDYSIPIYSYWSYGNGKVSSFACEFSNFWLSQWSLDSTGGQFLQNMVFNNIPDERISAPFLIEVVDNGTISTVTVATPTLNQNANLILSITAPDGTVVQRTMIFTSENYITTFDSEMVGTYSMSFRYTLGSTSYSTEYKYDRSYSPEYNSFIHYEESNLNHMVNNNGKVFTSGADVKLENDMSNITTFSYDFTVLFMTLAVCMFILDIIIRKVKWVDIVNLFKKKQKKLG